MAGIAGAEPALLALRDEGYVECAGLGVAVRACIAAASRVIIASRLAKIPAAAMRAGVPRDWIRSTARGGSNSGRGYSYTNPNNKNDIVRFMTGNPEAKNASQRAPYVVRQLNGKFYDSSGKVVPKNSAEAHIPMNQFSFGG